MPISSAWSESRQSLASKTFPQNFSPFPPKNYWLRPFRFFPQWSCFSFPPSFSTQTYFVGAIFPMPRCATHCHTLPRCATHCHTLPRCATNCHTLPHIAMLCHTLPRCATHCHTLPRHATPDPFFPKWRDLLKAPKCWTPFSLSTFSFKTEQRLETVSAKSWKHFLKVLSSFGWEWVPFES